MGAFTGIRHLMDWPNASAGTGIDASQFHGEFARPSVVLVRRDQSWPMQGGVGEAMAPVVLTAHR